MAKLVTIFGGSGFVGRYVARRMAKAGWRVRVAVRRPNEALFVKPYGAVGQVEPILANVRNDASVLAALAGADAVVNCVGTFDSFGPNSMEAVQADAPGRIARLAAQAGVPCLVHLSAIGADPEAASTYARTKGEGEAAVLAAFPGAVILRPSVIFGTEDGFFNRFAGMARLGPILPLVGGKTRFQPVYVDDVAAAVEAALTKGADGIYELGGPEVDSLSSLVRRMLTQIRRRRLVINLPFWVGSVIGGALDFASALSLWLFPNKILTRDQVRSLRHDSLVAKGAKGLGDLGVEPTAMEAVIGEYLWRFRPSGQYLAIKESAKHLRKA